MDCSCWLTLIVVLYVVFDVHYFLRIATTVLWGRLFEKKKKPSDETTIYNICTSQDADTFLRHMNNARYLREFDFARYHYYDKTGIYKALRKRGGGGVQGASSIRYRRAVPMFTMYKVTTKLIYWEDRHVYLEQKLISVNDNFIRAIGLSKQTLFGTDVPAGDIIAEAEPGIQKPELTKELKLWIDSMQESSETLKKQR